MLYLGTSGWPSEGDCAGLSPRQRRRRYFTLFNSIELIQTHRRVPDWDLVGRWRAYAPAGFVYSWVAPRYLTYRPGGEERRALRRFLRRHKRLGRARGGVRFVVPAGVDPAAFGEWLAMLAELELPGDYAFEVGEGLGELLEPYGWVMVNRPGAWQYTLDRTPAAGVHGYAYYGSLAAALRHQREVAPERG
jgi:uncharacterized protein YecE (DUF72 family)